MYLTPEHLKFGFVRLRVSSYSIKWERHSEFARYSIVQSLPERGHSIAMADSKLAANGFERMLVVTTPATTETRGDRISQRLLELEIYR